MQSESRESTRSVWANIGHLLVAGLSLTTILRARADRLHARGPEPVVLGLLALILAAISGWQLASEGAVFNAYGLTGFLAAAVLSPALLVMLRSDQRVFEAKVVVALLFATTAWQLVAMIAVVALWPMVLERQPWLDAHEQMITVVASYVWLAWILLVTWRIGAIASAAGPKRIGGWLVVATLIGSFVLPYSAIIHAPGDDRAGSAGLLQMGVNWAHAAMAPKRAAVADRREAPPDHEALLYRQPALLEATLATLKPSAPDRPQMYFLGAAPYAAEGVFMRETQSIQRIVDERLDTAGRSVVLISHRTTHDTVPLANRTSIDRALAAIGRVMTPDKDVLLLYVTSHGSPGEVAVAIPGMYARNITPKDLRSALDRSGIKHRVIIVSACYSGSFIDELAEPNTAIFTASRKDRTSFGCSDERDWTYFGDAFFNHALRETRSLPAAFERAKVLVNDWETKQGLTPASEPQSFIGADIAAYLLTLEAALNRN